MFVKNNKPEKIENRIRALVPDLNNEEVSDIASNFTRYMRRGFDPDRIVRCLFIMMLVALPIGIAVTLLERALPESLQGYSWSLIFIAFFFLGRNWKNHADAEMLKEHLDAYIDQKNQAQSGRREILTPVPHTNCHTDLPSAMRK